MPNPVKYYGVRSDEWMTWKPRCDKSHAFVFFCTPEFSRVDDNGDEDKYVPLPLEPQQSTSTPIQALFLLSQRH